MSTLKVLVVDDDEIVCALLQDLLTKQGHQVNTYSDAQRGLAAAGKQAFDLVLLDIRMPVLNGIEVLKKMRPQLPKARFVMITASPEDELVGDAFSSGATLCLSKPIDPQKVNELLSILFA